MTEPTTAELLRRIEELEGRGTRRRTMRSRRPRGRRLAMGVAALVALMLVPVGVFASHQFTDVPTSNTFHASIAKVKGAGITGGCSATKYCPNDAVTRGQMAAFLARSAPRAETAFTGPVDLTSAETLLAQFPIIAGGGSGGTAALTVQATVNVETNDASGCPCTAGFYIISDSSPYGSFNQYATVTDTNIDFEGTLWGVATTSITVLLQVPTGVAENVYLVGWTQDGANLVAWGEMVGTVALFDGLGNNVVIPSTTTAGASDGPAGRGSR